MQERGEGEAVSICVFCQFQRRFCSGRTEEIGTDVAILAQAILAQAHIDALCTAAAHRRGRGGLESLRESSVAILAQAILAQAILA